jgi:hypothetical protein
LYLGFFDLVLWGLLAAMLGLSFLLRDTLHIAKLLLQSRFVRAVFCCYLELLNLIRIDDLVAIKQSPYFLGVFQVDMLRFRSRLNMLLRRLQSLLDYFLLLAVELSNQILSRVMNITLNILVIILHCLYSCCDIFQTYNFWRLLIISLTGVRCAFAMPAQVGIVWGEHRLISSCLSVT